MADPLEIKDARTAAVFANRRRVGILLALAGQERSLSELAAFTGERMSLLLHHVRALQAAGLVQVAREQARAGRPIRFYRAMGAVPLDDSENPALIHPRLRTRAKFRHGHPVYFSIWKVCTTGGIPTITCPPMDMIAP